MPIKNQEKDKSKSAEKKFRTYYNRVEFPDKKHEMPVKISNLSSDAVSDLQLLYTAWREATEDYLIDALVDLTRAREKYEFEYDKLFLTTKGATVKEREARVRTDDAIHQLYQKYQDAELLHTMLQGKKASYDNCLAVISREITRRSNTV